MKRFYLIGFFSLLTFDTLTQICTKYTAMASDPLDFSLAWLIRIMSTYWVYIAIGGYLGSFVSWMTLLRYAPVGPSFAASHLELVSVTLLSVWLFGEPLNSYKVIGGALIVAGVLCLAKNEGTASGSKT